MGLIVICASVVGLILLYIGIIETARYYETKTSSPLQDQAQDHNIVIGIGGKNYQGRARFHAQCQLCDWFASYDEKPTEDQVRYEHDHEIEVLNEGRPDYPF
jgi:hypothetical protein